MAIFVPAESKPAFDSSIMLFLASPLCMCLAETFMIRGLWYRSSPAFHRLHGFDLPFLAWIPAAGAFGFLQLIRKHTREGRILPQLASSFSTGWLCCCWPRTC